jgi:trimethylamine--corrinoid protein Co-methyltransferase
MLFAARKGFPAAFAPVSGTADMLGGAQTQAMVQQLSSCLATLMLSQLERPGAPVLLAVTPVLQNEGCVVRAAAPQVVQATAALSDVAKRLGLPAVGWGGCSDSKIFDQQAVIESAVSLALGGLSGAGVVVGAGGLESGQLLSYDLLVLADEIISMCRHIYRGITVDADHLAVDVIDRVGPGGHFLAEEHTLRHFRTQHWFPELLQRTSYAAWQAEGAKTLSERTREKVLRLLQVHTPEAMDDDTEAALRRMVAAESSDPANDETALA